MVFVTLTVWLYILVAYLRRRWLVAPVLIQVLHILATQNTFKYQMGDDSITLRRAACRRSPK